MTRAITMYMRAAALAVAFHRVAHAQQCYYPNGNKAPDTEKPCSTAEGSACCPEKWECMDNGLCYYDPDKLYGRYSCTDKDWKSSGCPSNMCTYNMNAPGGEAVSQCSNHGNQWCCDGDRTNVDCCQESPQPRPFFMLQDPVAYGTAGGNIGSSAPNLASITGKASGGGGGGGSGPPTSTAPPSASTSAANDPSSSSPSTDQSNASTGFSTSATSASTGQASNTAGPTSTADIPPPGSLTDPAPKHNNIGLIVGCAVGVPLALCLLGILIWMLRKRRQLKSSPTSPSPVSSPSMRKHEFTQSNIPELGDGQGVGPTRPISTVPGHAEMDSGTAFAPGTIPYSPAAVGMGGGHGAGQGHMSWGSDMSHHMDSSPAPNPYSVLGGDGGPAATKYRYSAAPGGLNNVPEMAELPSVVTPPEGPGYRRASHPAAAELGDPSPPAQTNANAAGEYPGMMR